MKLPFTINPKDVADISHDVIQDYRKSSQSTKNITTGIIFSLVCIICIFIFIIFNNSLSSATNTIATVSGYVVGLFDAVSDAPRVYLDGKNEGLSAEDTKANVTTEFSNTGKLEVLVSGVTITDLHKYADKYAGLYVSKGYAVFSVNLSSAEVSVNDKSINITVDEPECEVFVDELSTRKIAEWTHQLWDGSEDDGYFAYLNSWNKTKEELANAIDGYDDLMTLAKNSAEKQIPTIIGSMLSSGKTINIQFRESSNE